MMVFKNISTSFYFLLGQRLVQWIVNLMWDFRNYFVPCKESMHVMTSIMACFTQCCCTNDGSHLQLASKKA